MTDSLTGLLNRRGLAGKLADTARWVTNGERLAFFHLDLDKFKTVNDALGHDAGDLVLTRISRTLLENAPKRAAVARVGGDEFVVAMPTHRCDDHIMILAESLREAITRPALCNGRLCQVGATIGVSFWSPTAPDCFEHALLDADTALIRGKSDGRNRTVMFTSEMRMHAVETARIASRIKESLGDGQFIPYFQPQVAWPSGRLCGIETLARWRKPDGHLLPAVSFVNVANETGLIVEIDQQMMTKGLDAFKRFSDEGDLQDANISFNFSKPRLSDPDLLAQVSKAVADRGLSNTQISIEILETTLLDHRSETVSRNICALADAGFKIELDDFGTGHTALASLREFPVDSIKIDRSLIRSINTDPSLQAITDGIFHLCQRLDIEVIAEGVETEAERETLTDMGLTILQGYLFAKPMSFADMAVWIVEDCGLSRTENLCPVASPR
jgi:diguanylate cyclase (GGDEF)-like protein